MLLNSDCVSFYISLIDLRCDTFDMVNPEFCSLSIFKHSDDQTERIIQRIALLAKNRIYQIKDLELDSQTALPIVTKVE